MNIASAISYFKSEWERRIGPKSEFSSNLTPETRNFRRLLSDAPCDAIEAILKGVVAEQSSAPATATAETLCRKHDDRHLWLISICCMGVSAACVIELLFRVYGRISCNDGCVVHGHISALGMIGLVLFAIVSAGAGMFFRRRHHCLSKQSSVLLQPQTFVTNVDIANESINNTVAIFYKAIKDVVAYVKEKEDDLALGFDISDSKSFGEWIQKFVDYVNENQQNTDVVILKSELLSKLRTMGISVYDTLHRGKDGVVQLPEKNSYRDERSDETAEYTTVKHAAVISRRGVLAIGEIQ